MASIAPSLTPPGCTTGTPVGGTAVTLGCADPVPGMCHAPVIPISALAHLLPGDAMALRDAAAAAPPMGFAMTAGASLQTGPEPGFGKTWGGSALPWDAGGVVGPRTSTGVDPGCCDGLPQMSPVPLPMSLATLLAALALLAMLGLWRRSGRPRRP